MDWRIQTTDFGFYALSYGVEGDTFTHPFYALTGTPTDFPTVFTGDAVRTYSFAEDPIQQLPVPFFRAGLIDSFAGAANSDIYVIESPDISLPDSQHVRLLQTWLQISGTGANQQSAVGVTAGDFAPLDGGGYGLWTGRRGSYRSSAEDEATLEYGSLKTLGAPDGGTEVFGPNGSNFVLSTDVTGSDAFGDNAINSHSYFSTVHVANLVDDPVPDAPRADHQLLGFASGMVEEARSGTPGTSVTSMYSDASQFSDQAGFRIASSSGSNQVGGDLAIIDQFNSSPEASLHLAFGSGYDLNSPGGSTYINDALFGAGTSGPDIGADTADQSDDRFTSSYVTKDNGSQLVYQQGEYPVTYLVSSGAVDLGSDPAFMGGTSICACSFLEWGWWGGQPRLATESDPTTEFLQQSIHLGTWVAGDIASTSALDSALENEQLSGTATYSGFAIGTVLSVNQNDDTNPYKPVLTQYIAGGSVNLTWDFSSRSGEFGMTFDGKSLAGIVSDPGAVDRALFSGNIFGTGLAGTVNGAIVSNVDHTTNETLALNAGFIGDFGIYGENYAATGIIAGETSEGTPSFPTTLALPARVLTAGDFYTPTDNLDTIGNPGVVGLVGDGSGEGETGNDNTTDLQVYLKSGGSPVPRTERRPERAGRPVRAHEPFGVRRNRPRRRRGARLSRLPGSLWAGILWAGRVRCLPVDLSDRRRPATGLCDQRNPDDHHAEWWHRRVRRGGRARLQPQRRPDSTDPRTLHARRLHICGRIVCAGVRLEHRR